MQLHLMMDPEVFIQHGSIIRGYQWVSYAFYWGVKNIYLVQIATMNRENKGTWATHQSYDPVMCSETV